ncbi:autotransporter outer membrane beta-barrel domain-containing protein [Pseudomonas gingeri]|uniref:autotransporter outer membrane beta-barrel domain-containing protein n=1 Tax=Pseudomonas TaxID=286 RepID=UPI0015A4EC13|nr:autotransporter outer membrane beta-barrel domain-containing protein [Pseudomonas gingeri]NVZ64110.1 autotransporter outer membrane beta-barrel domain-containing protein [Pseudomonas gingeri]NVZ76588.1 autotransporter outer membrane beta-barrel domain-containing protein [Pseudomonas gingeri]
MKTFMIHPTLRTMVNLASTSLLLCSAVELQAAPAEDDPPLWLASNTPSLLPAGQPWALDNSERLPGARFAAIVANNGNPETYTGFHDRALGLSEAGNLDPLFSGAFGDLLIIPGAYANRSGGHTVRAGVFTGQSGPLDQVDGFVMAPRDPRADGLNAAGNNVGAFWSLTGQQGWHVNLTAMNNQGTTYIRSPQGTLQATSSRGQTFSLEGGFPIGLGNNWVIEPQAQLVNQQVSGNVAGLTEASADQSLWSGRIGARLKGAYEVRGLPVEPYLRTNFWHTFGTGNTLSLEQVDKISSSRNASTVELGLGLVARVSPTVSLYVSADYSGTSDDNGLNGIIGNIGVRMRW